MLLKRDLTKCATVKQVVLNGVTVFLPYKWQNINGEKLGSKNPNYGGVIVITRYNFISPFITGRGPQPPAHLESNDEISLVP